jgi:hypothetical protein
MTPDFKSFETFEEIEECLNNASDTFRNSPDFALTSEATFEYIMTLFNGITAVYRMARIEIQKQNFRLKGDA